jgi:hypothetical protein
MLRTLSFAAGAALALAGSAVQAQPAGDANACLTISSIQGSKLADPRTLYVRADGGRTYRIGFAANCNSADSYSLILHPVDNGGQVCHAIGLDVRVRGTGETCTPSSLTRLSREEAAALPAKLKP